MKTGDYITIKGDSYIYQIKNIQGNKLTVEDGHNKQYIVDQSKVRKIS
tara:strand:- start:845 stop:988 length:144 start_codon:yes stop_codon:yes gene_type:complete